VTGNVEPWTAQDVAIAADALCCRRDELRRRGIPVKDFAKENKLRLKQMALDRQVREEQQAYEAQQASRLFKLARFEDVPAVLNTRPSTASRPPSSASSAGHQSAEPTVAHLQLEVRSSRADRPSYTAHVPMVRQQAPAASTHEPDENLYEVLLRLYIQSIRSTQYRRSVAHRLIRVL